jgi:hypothetical protein
MPSYFQTQTWITNDQLNSIEWGWELFEGCLVPTNSTQPAAPDFLLNIIKCNRIKCDSKRCTCRKHDLELLVGCGECHGISCSNCRSISDMDFADMVDLDLVSAICS